MTANVQTLRKEKRQRAKKAAQQKLTVVLPSDLVERLDLIAPNRKRSKFIEDAITAQINLAEQVAVLDETAGGWSAENHPELDNPQAVEDWLREFRNQWTLPIVGTDEPIST